MMDPSALGLLADGLPPRPPMRVLIAGAGMAGLVAADLLLRAGHTPLIIEARQRVGGRVLTLREPFADGLYGEAGAMRIPTAHTLTIALCRRFGLPLLPFTIRNPDAWALIRGTRRRRGAALADPENLGFPVGAHERGTPVVTLWERAIAPIVARVRSEGWGAVTAEYDRLSTRAFLDQAGWSEGAIELLGLLLDMECFMQTNLLELLREEAEDLYTSVLRLDGGMDQLPRALAARLQPHIRYGARLVALDQGPHGVTGFVETGAGRRAIEADQAIVTLPIPALRNVEMLTPLSYGKQQAIRQIAYEASVKIFLQFRERFWETADGISGGLSVSDLPIRNSYYPDHGRETGRGVVIASYAKEVDARGWGALPPERQVERALADFAQMHPQALDAFEVGASKVWQHDPYAGGACALFAPGQQLRLHDQIRASEGRIHFAGEHTTLLHGWIEGAVESGIAAARAAHASP
jgi:monoamine oxidase